MLYGVQVTSISPVFVGRAGELAVLTGALARAAEGEPQTLLVGGEAGVGKTRLLEEFLALARAEGAVTAVGGCLELGADGLPFAPFATALRALHRQLGTDLDRAAAGRETDLARLLPDMAPPEPPPPAPGTHGGVPYENAGAPHENGAPYAGGAHPTARYGPGARESHDQEGRARLFEVTAQLLERLAAGRTLVVVIEDLHWADRSTRELLGYLFRSLQSCRLVLLASYRTDDIHRRHPLRPFIAEQDRLRTVRRIEVPRLSREEVRRQLTGIRGTEPDRHLADEIFERSEGNPFFVEELATSDYASCGLSDSLRDLLLVRVEALPEPAQRIVRTAARNTTVEYALLAAVTGADDDELIEALRVAVGANILVPTEEGEAYRFRHALLREAILDDLLPGERSRLSRRYAEALEADPSLVRAEERAARLAGYWYRAHDAAKALPAVLAAAGEARRRHAYAEKLKLLERAMELWDEVPPEQREHLPELGYPESYPACGCDPDRPGCHPHFLDLLAEAVVAARWDESWDRALTLAKKALKLIDERQDPVRAAWFWMQRSRLMTGMGRGDGWAEIARAQELVRGLPPSAVHADVLALAATWHSMHVSATDTLPLAERAVELAGLVGAEEVALSGRVTLAWLRAGAGEEDRGIAEMHAVREEVGRRPFPQVMGRVHGNLVDLLHKAGRSAEAVETARQGIVVLHRHGLHNAAGFTAGNLAEALLALGEWDEAAAVLEEYRGRVRGARSLASIALHEAGLALDRGAYDRVPGLIAACRSHLGRNDMEPQYELPLAEAEMREAAAAGRFGEARAALERALDLLPLLGQEPYVWQLLVAGAAMTADIRGLPGTDEALQRELVARLRASARGVAHRSPLWAAWSRRFDAELARARGEHAPALWEEAASAFEPYGYPYLSACLAFRRAEALLGSTGPYEGAGGKEREDRAGRQEREERREEARRAAGALLARAHTTALRLGARPLREDVAVLARRARLPLPDGGPEAPDDAAVPVPGEPCDPAAELGLTPREREVLRLVTAGHSNRAIAGELFISPKTVSVHVSNILAKLGVSGRGEAAAFAHRMRMFAEPGPERVG
ncbi:helix-turn-helix transcriptional regulator [Streptomyces albus]|uniref:helix-turn-helix transcriptional regulator n=1 Tax=Streptomyces albus TaxID=1888 RepID=UPI0004CBAC7C|nr:helix-turn-helix transcriptional regulator [Streptomyces albus]